jgi:hypothetical protein
MIMNVSASKFLCAVQGRTARVAVGASTTRGYAEGTVDAARTFLSELELRRFGVTRAATFRAELDDATDELRRRLPRGARSWGLARKLMNIFLRDALYTTHLCEKYGLDAAEKYFEVPLDSITSGRLQEEAGRGVLPAWKGVKHLHPGASDKYQDYAEELAQQRGHARVHLDTYWWGKRVR